MDKLESTNQLLHDLERKLSLNSTSSSTYTAQSHGSVVQDPTHSGLARRNIQSSVLSYIKGNQAEFDADRVFTDRQEKFATTFAREYSPQQSTPKNASDPGFGHEAGGLDSAKSYGISALGTATTTEFDAVKLSSEIMSDLTENAPGYSDMGDLREGLGVSKPASEHSTNDYTGYSDDTFESEDDFVDEFGDEFDANTRTFDGDLHDTDDDMLPPSPPRSPPREMDPNKLYGLYDFSGPDPSHCTLFRDEPVYLLNDSDNYWWLIKKLTKQERQVLQLGCGSREDVESDEEDGKIGFVPAECLETYGERLARLNCFKNEELERTSRETLPMSAASKSSLEQTADGVSISEARSSDRSVSSKYESQGSLGTITLGRSSSILKKVGAYKHSNKSVTFENLGEVYFDDPDTDSNFDDVIDFSDHYYSVSHEDVASDKHGKVRSDKKQIFEGDSEKHSEILSDIFPAETPLQIKKSRATAMPESRGIPGFSQPKFALSADNASIGSFSPDTPTTNQFSRVSVGDESDDDSKLRRSVILDRLNIVTSDIHEHEEKSSATRDPTFGGTFDHHGDSGDGSDGSPYESYFSDRMKTHNSNSRSISASGMFEPGEGSDDQYSRKSASVEDLNTPLTSVNSLNVVGSPNVQKPAAEKRKKRPVHDMFMPILGQLDELTERLAELEQSFDVEATREA